MTVTFHALWLICALAPPALAAVPTGNRWMVFLAVASGFAAGAWWFGPSTLPDAVWVGILAALVAAIRLVRSDAMLAACCTAGALSAVWMSLLRLEGVLWPVAAAASLAPPLLSAFLTTRRPHFAPRILRDEALLITVTLGLAVAVLPGILDGWRSATILNIQDKATAARVVPGWTLALTAGSVSAGGLFGLWRRG